MTENIPNSKAHPETEPELEKEPIFTVALCQININVKYIVNMAKLLTSDSLRWMLIPWYKKHRKLKFQLCTQQLSR